MIFAEVASRVGLLGKVNLPRELSERARSTIPVISLTMPWGPSLFLRRLLHPQVPRHMLLAANSAQSLAASESLGRPSCRFQVGAKCLQVEDTCKSKHSEGVKSHSERKSVHISPVNILLLNPFVRQIFLQATCNEASHDDSEKLVRQINIWATSGVTSQRHPVDFVRIQEWQLTRYLLSLKDIGVYFDVSFGFDSPTYRESNLGHRENLRKKFENGETLRSSEGRKSQAQGGSRFPFPGTWSRNLLIHEHDNKVIVVDQWRLVPFPVAEMDRGVPMPQGTALIERRIELDRVTIIMFITRNNNMQAGPAVINSNGRARFKKRIKKAGYMPGLNYR
ncbi:hypothetical protein ALC57_13491 [Trachymyrmex cornetzi]|uniref:Uncharacterized protein n=1 Tax=Trachymyrmex cornetzi TaxID=471704 RepID=A0A195DPB2_9HYME|nr:hypothetical protein ALC57_13491 [Trachymyrmex cornetzi]